jgi:hypothetical protein
MPSAIESASNLSEALERLKDKPVPGNFAPQSKRAACSRFAVDMSACLDTALARSGVSDKLCGRGKASSTLSSSLAFTSDLPGNILETARWSQYLCTFGPQCFANIGDPSQYWETFLSKH